MALVFDNGVVINHSLAEHYLSDLDALCERDYGMSYFHSRIICLDMDAYESSLSGNNDATMDAAIGVANYENNRKTDSRHLLVELRFKYKSTNNFKVENMRQKVSHTKDLLLGNLIHGDPFFLYTEEVAPKARSYFSRLSHQYRDVCNWKALSISDFFGCVFDESSFPYQPINDLDQIVADVSLKYQNGGFAAMVSIVEYWINEAKKYDLRYNKLESRAIAGVLDAFLKQLPASKDGFENDYVALLEESLKPILC